MISIGLVAHPIEEELPPGAAVRVNNNDQIFDSTAVLAIPKNVTVIRAWIDIQSQPIRHARLVDTFPVPNKGSDGLINYTARGHADQGDPSSLAWRIRAIVIKDDQPLLITTVGWIVFITLIAVGILFVIIPVIRRSARR